MTASPPLRAREVAAVALAGCLLAVAMNWSLASRLDRVVTPNLGDPLLQAWQVAWGGHALIHQPLRYFQSNTFWPERDSLAFSDALIGYAPAGLLGRGAKAALVRYNLLVLFTYALAFVGAFLLARELGAGPAAWVGSAAFAYAPWRLSQNGHLHVISSGGIPLSLFLLLRGYRRRRPGMVLAGWLVATWQLSLGFTLGLQLAYLLAVLGALAAGSWLRRGRPAPDRALVRATAAGILVFVAWAGLQARPYLRVDRDHPEARRTVEEVTFYSPPPKGFLAAPQESFVWGERTREIRASLPWFREQTLFPGAAILGLALLGSTAPAYSRRLRAWLAIAVVVSAILSLGFAMGGGRFTYRLLYEHAPGWDAVRTPGRIATLTTLALGLLAAAGARALIGSPRRRGGERFGTAPAARGAGIVLLVGVILFEGSGRLPLAAVPRVPAGQLRTAAPQLHLPSDVLRDLTYMYWSTEGFPRLVNGHSAFVPRSLQELRARMRTFPDAESVAVLRALGVRTVVLHPDLAPGTPWQDAARRSLEGLPVVRQEVGGVVLYHIAPG